MKIVADENIPLTHAFFDSLGEVLTVPSRELSREHTLDADILVVRSIVPVGRSLLEDTAVKFVGTCTAGTDHLDTQFMDERSIRWRGAAGCNAGAVGDYIFSVLAALDLDYLNSKVGIIGCGHVGGSLFRRLDALGVECLCYDPLLTGKQQAGLTSLPDVLRADIVCIHAPLTTSGPHPSHHLLGAEQLSRLRPGTTLINAGRGGVIDNAALGEVLQKRSDLQVVLDVWESEPDIDTALYDRVTLGTPHIAGHSYDGKVKGTEIIYRHVCEFLQRPATVTFAELDSDSPRNICLQGTDPRQAINEAILAAYDVRTDHDCFKRALQKEATPRQAFDTLRKNYPMRREFSNYLIKLAEPDEQLANQLEVIGFQIMDN
jgi:erythronate-4-phosphate dehydrogenase